MTRHTLSTLVVYDYVARDPLRFSSAGGRSLAAVGDFAAAGFSGRVAARAAGGATLASAAAAVAAAA